MRKKLLNTLAEFISTKPWWSALVLLTVSIVLGIMAEQLKMKTDFTDLMPQDDPMVEEYDRIISEFDGAMSMLVVAEGDPEKLIEFAEKAAPEIEKLTQYFKKVDYRLPKDLIAEHALMLMKSDDLKKNRTLFENPNLTGLLKNLNITFEREYTGSGGGSIEGQEQEQGALRFMDGIQTFTDELINSLNNNQYSGARAADAILMGDTYYRSWDREMLIMQIIPSFDWQQMDAYPLATNAAEEIVKGVAKEFGVEAGLTGAIPLQRDELRAMENDSFIITSIALVLILILFVIAFKMIISPILAIITLMVGVVWALGVTWLVTGTLNMMTAMMGVILVGLGIDFSIHIIAAYSEKRAAGKNVKEAMHFTLYKTGLGVLTGGVTTATAFLTFLFTRTQGFREFGLSLGLGIVMTMIAAITILPTLLVIRERILFRIRGSEKKEAPKDISYRRLGKFAKKLALKPGLTLMIVVLLSLFIGWRGSKIEWDYNYLNMEPVGLETIILQDKMIEKMDMSADYAYFTANSIEEASDLTQKAKKIKTAGMVRSIVDFLPSKAEQENRQNIVKDIRDSIQNAKTSPSFTQEDLTELQKELVRLEANVMEIQDMANISGQDKIYLKTGLLVGVVPEDEDETVKQWQRQLAVASPDISTGILSKLVHQIEEAGLSQLRELKLFHQDFSKTFKTMAMKMANPEVITLETIPFNIRNQYVGKSGKLFLVTVFPKANVWDQLFLERFSDELEAVSNRATGIPVVYRRLIDLFSEDGKFATGLSLIVIFLIILLDFRKPRKALLAIVPLVVGSLWMLGIMEISGLYLTMLNAMAVPMIIGIGVDDGIHIIHRYQLEGRKEHYTVFSSTGRAILLTSLTTMLGFGSLTFATYRGLGSMGIALFIGVGTCFLATVLIIPAVMGWVSKQKGD